MPTRAATFALGAVALYAAPAVFGLLGVVAGLQLQVTSLRIAYHYWRTR